MIRLSLEEKKEIGYQYVMDLLDPASPYGVKRLREEGFYAPEQQAELEISRNRRSETVSRITELRKFIRSQSAELTEFDETLVRHRIRKITVHPDRLTIEFKTGDIVETKS